MHASVVTVVLYAKGSVGVDLKWTRGTVGRIAACWAWPCLKQTPVQPNTVTPFGWWRLLQLYSTSFSHNSSSSLQLPARQQCFSLTQLQLQPAEQGESLVWACSGTTVPVFQTFTSTRQTKFLLSKVCFALSEKWTLWCEIVELIDSLIIMSLFSVGTSSTE